MSALRSVAAMLESIGSDVHIRGLSRWLIATGEKEENTMQREGDRACGPIQQHKETVER